MDLVFFLTGALGFGPAILIMWYALRKYSYPFTEKTFFDDRKAFGLMAGGMMVGAVLAIIESFLYPSFKGENFYIDLFVLLYVFMFPVAEALGKVAILNFPWIRKRFDNVFYGASFGAGFSAVWVMQGAYLALTSPGLIASASWLFAVLAWSFALALMHVSTGAIVGASCAKGMVWTGFAKAFGLHALLNLLMAPFFLTGELWFSAPLMLALSILVFYDTHRTTVPGSLPVELQRELRRSARRGDGA
ncbi:MAG: hypothetical protein HZB92_06635 [Euryarchaeota archaeon]|nr:hypothetical protein [Euryarchaeota archaeon]